MRKLFSKWPRKTIVAISFISLTLCWNGTLTSETKKTKQITKAPRECLNCGVVTCGTSSASATSDVIIQGSLASINTSLNFIKAFLLSDLVETFTITGDVGGLISLTEELFEDFRETWTILDTIGGCDLQFIESKIDVLDVNLEIVDDRAESIESKVDELFEDFQETWTILDSLESCDLQFVESKIDELFVDFQETWTALGSIVIDPEDFQETWTLIGNTSDTLDGSITPATVMDVNATTTLSVIQWLKAIYDKVK